MKDTNSQCPEGKALCWCACTADDRPWHSCSSAAKLKQLLQCAHSSCGAGTGQQGYQKGTDLKVSRMALRSRSAICMRFSASLAASCTCMEPQTW